MGHNHVLDSVQINAKIILNKILKTTRYIATTTVMTRCVIFYIQHKLYASSSAIR